MHQLLLADPAFYWEGGGDGCFARAVLMVDRMEREGVPTGAIGKVLLVHKNAPRRGWNLLTRLGGTQTWVQHVVPTLHTDIGTHVIDPMLCDAAEEERFWLMRFPAQPLNPTVPPPTSQFVQTLLRSSASAFRQFLALAAQRPDYCRHLLSEPSIAARLEQMGDPVRLWLEQSGPITDSFDSHLANLAIVAEQLGALVRGEVVRVAHGIDFFANVFWDTAGPGGARGVRSALHELTRIRLKATP